MFRFFLKRDQIPITVHQMSPVPQHRIGVSPKEDHRQSRSGRMLTESRVDWFGSTFAEPAGHQCCRTPAGHFLSLHALPFHLGDRRFGMRTAKRRARWHDKGRVDVQSRNRTYETCITMRSVYNNLSVSPGQHILLLSICQILQLC